MLAGGTAGRRTEVMSSCSGINSPEQFCSLAASFKASASSGRRTVANTLKPKLGEMQSNSLANPTRSPYNNKHHRTQSQFDACPSVRAAVNECKETPGVRTRKLLKGAAVVAFVPPDLRRRVDGAGPWVRHITEPELLPIPRPPPQGPDPHHINTSLRLLSNACPPPPVLSPRPPPKQSPVLLPYPRPAAPTPSPQA